MAWADLNSWAHIFVADLGSDGAWVPFDRAVSRHRHQLEDFLGRGLTYSSLAGAIDRAGGRRPDGRSYTDKQLNTALRRARRYAENKSAAPPTPSPKPEQPRPQRPTATAEQMSTHGRRVHIQKAAENITKNAALPSVIQTGADDLNQELSNEDIRAALARIRRADP